MADPQTTDLGYDYRVELVKLATNLADRVTGGATNEESAKRWAREFRRYYRYLGATVKYAGNHPGDASSWERMASRTEEELSA